MDIQWHGLSCFSFKSKQGVLVTDPYDSEAVGLKMPKLQTDVCLANAEYRLHHNLTAIGKDAVIFDWPGEYEAHGIIIQAIKAYDRPREKEDKKDNAKPVLIYSIKMEEFSICHLSNLGHKLTPEMLEMIGNVDVLLIPVGGVNCLDAKKAHEVVEQIEPRLLIPMYYKIPGVKLPLADVEQFTKEMGQHDLTPEKVLKLQTPGSLPTEHTEYRLLEPVLG